MKKVKRNWNWGI